MHSGLFVELSNLLCHLIGRVTCITNLNQFKALSDVVVVYAVSCLTNYHHSLRFDERIVV